MDGEQRRISRLQDGRTGDRDVRITLANLTKTHPLAGASSKVGAMGFTGRGSRCTTEATKQE